MTAVTTRAVESRILDRLANGAEQVHPDLDGRRAASERLLHDLHRALTEATKFEPRAYSARFETQTKLLVGDVVTISINWKGNLKVRLVDTMGEKPPAPELRYNARRRTWEHALLAPMISPVEAVLDIIQPIALAAARHPDTACPAASVPSTGSASRMSPFRRGRAQQDPAAQ